MNLRNITNEGLVKELLEFDAHKYGNISYRKEGDEYEFYIDINEYNLCLKGIKEIEVYVRN